MYTIQEHLTKFDWYPGHLRWLGYDVDVEAKRANLRGANLSGAYLRGANLHEANLREANLGGAKYNVLGVLQADWRGGISPRLCAVMMAFDRDAHPHPEQFKPWAQDGKCPLESASIARALLFDEKREPYNHSLAAPSVWDLWTMIASEFGVQI